MSVAKLWAIILYLRGLLIPVSLDLKEFYQLIEVEKKYFNDYLTSGPSGLKTTINKGNKVRLLKRATAMAIPVRKPKYIVGIKLDKVRTENPTVIVMEV